MDGWMFCSPAKFNCCKVERRREEKRAPSSELTFLRTKIRPVPPPSLLPSCVASTMYVPACAALKGRREEKSQGLIYYVTLGMYSSREGEKRLTTGLTNKQRDQIGAILYVVKSASLVRLLTRLFLPGETYLQSMRAHL